MIIYQIANIDDKMSIIKLAGKLKGDLAVLYKKYVKEYTPYKAIMMARKELKSVEAAPVFKKKAVPIQGQLFDLEEYSVIKANKRWKK